MMNATATLAELDHVACPRCRYDLRGTVTAWRDVCPLEGLCTECGLALDWPAVIVPWKFEPTWCVEFARPARRVPLAVVWTFLRSFRPARFWRDHDMSHRVRWRRLWMYLAALLVAVLVTYVAMQALLAVRVHMVVQSDMALARGQLQTGMDSLDTMMESMAPGPEREAALAHMQNLQRSLNATTMMPVTLPDAVLHAVTMPFATQPRYARNYVGTWSYPAPADLRYALADSYWAQSGRSLIDTSESQMMLLFVGLSASWSAWIALPFGFALLPVTRRRYMVGWQHIARIFLYSMWIPAAACMVVLISSSLAFALMVWPEVLFVGGLAFGGWGVLVLTVLWWRAAIRHYLHVPHALAVAALLALLGVVLTPLAAGCVGVSLRAMF